MAYKTLLKLNGYEIHNIVGYDDLPSTQDGENSGRTPSLKMNRDILGRLMSINVQLGITSKDEVMTILNILKSPNITVDFLDSETDTLKTINCYCIDPQKSRLQGMMDYFESLSFILNSNERYD